MQPCLPVNQGVYELICYGVHNGDIQIDRGDSNLGQCNAWQVSGANLLTCGNDILHVDAKTGQTDSQQPEMAYVLKTLAMATDDGLPPIQYWPHDIVEASAPYGKSIRMAHDYLGSDFPKISLELINGLKELIRQKPTGEQAKRQMFDMIKMLGARTNFKTPWDNLVQISSVEKESTSNELRGMQTNWMLYILCAGALLQMIINFAKQKQDEVTEKINNREWKIDNKGYLYFGRTKKSENIKIETYFNEKIWEDENIDKEALINKADEAITNAREILENCCPNHLPSEESITKANLGNTKDLEDTLDYPTLVVSQLIHIRYGYLGENAAEELISSK